MATTIISRINYRNNTSMRRWIYHAMIMAFNLLLVSPEVFARQGAPPISSSQTTLALKAIPALELPAVDTQALLAKDAKAEKPNLRRYAVPAKVKITPKTHGIWEPLDDGSRLWRLRIAAPGATDLNFGFTRYRLPVGATLYIYSESEQYYEGPYTDQDNKAHGQLWTPMVPGSRAVIELYLPAGVTSEPELTLTQIGTGYRNLFQRPLPSTFKHSTPKQGACNIDVVCPEGAPWRNQLRSVATYSLGGTALCSGQMIMDVPGSFRPFFLTANHCGVSEANAPSMVIYLNFESPTCGALSGGSMSENQTGATFRAAKANVDFALVELDQMPDPSFNVFYSGWDRSDVAPQGSVGIHHPSTDEKAISFNDNGLTTGASCISGRGEPDTHWIVDNWERGTTEPGSSGSGLWDPDTKLLVGFLSGGEASCTVIGPDCYGKFAAAWDSGTSAANRLKDWLDPHDQGSMRVEGAAPSPTVLYVSHQGLDSCSSNPQHDNGWWEPGETVNVSVAIRSNAHLSNVQGTLTSSTPGVTIINGTATWPDLDSGVDTRSNTPHFTIALAETVSCLTDIALKLDITTAEGGPFPLTFSHAVGTPLISDVPRAIPDQQSTASTLEVAQDVSLTDVEVLVDIQHTYVGDLTLTLRSPAGTEVVLLDRPGMPASEFGCNGTNMVVVFDDAMSFDLEHHCADTELWYSGNATPVQALSAFNGESSAGAWSLIVLDGAAGDIGTVMDWQLITTPPLSETCDICQASVDPSPSIASVTASSYQAPNIPENTLDGDIATRWSSQGVGEWIQYDLGTALTMSQVAIAWHKGDQRQATVDIEVSLDAQNWTRIVSGGTSSGATRDLEAYPFAATPARYVRIIGYGNTQNDWNSITEVEMYDQASVDPSPSIASVTASSHQAPNVPENTLDGDVATRWSSQGAGEWIQYDLGMALTMSQVAIAWYKGDQRQSTVDIEVSLDAQNWTRIVSGGASSGATRDLETYPFPAIPARYVRIVGYGNTQNDWNSITEVEMYGIPN